MEEVRKRFFSPRLWPLFAGVALTVILSWFAVNQYLTALPVAEENLRGLALSLAAAMESLAEKNDSLRAAEEIRAPDIAYMAIIDSKGTILFHSNAALIGRRAPDRRFAAVFDSGGFFGTRTRLGTGEEIYESNGPIHVRGETFDLRLALHTYRADSVERRARAGMAVTFSLMAAGWVMALLLHRAIVRVERQRREMARREQMARLGEMGAVIAHEVRNPLAGIKGYAQLLQENLAGEDGRSAGLIVGEAVRLEELVDGLLTYSRSEGGEVRPVDIRDPLTRSLELIAAEAGASGVAIESSVDGQLTVAGNRDRLQQLFLNLLRNALQAMPDGGKLRIAAQSRKRKVDIVISDTGPGIEEKYLGRLFEPFFTTKARGIGLGLAVCKEIVEDCHGEITVESGPGKGTTFRLCFPILGG